VIAIIEDLDEENLDEQDTLKLLERRRRIREQVQIKLKDEDEDRTCQLQPIKNVYATTPTSIPRLYFLFLLKDSMPLKDFWSDFLQGNEDMYDAYVSCHSGSCDNLPNYLKDKVVPANRSEQCSFERLDVMNQLLKTALENSESSQHPGDHFIFISETHVPLKSFDEVYNEFTSKNLSSFFDRWKGKGSMENLNKDAIQKAKELGIKVYDRHSNQFVKFNEYDVAGLYLKVITSRWNTLIREHAKLAVDMWNGSAKNLKDFLNKCPDEQWFGLAVFGLIGLYNDLPTDKILSRMYCRTPTFMISRRNPLLHDEDEEGNKNPKTMMQMLLHDPYSEVDDTYGPSAKIKKLSEHMLQKFKESDDYYFTQHIVDSLAKDCSMRKIWNKIILNKEFECEK